MLPPQEGFEACDGIGLHLYDRLIDETKFVTGDRSLQVLREFGTLLNGLVHARLEERVSAFARILGNVHRDVCVSNELRLAHPSS